MRTILFIPRKLANKHIQMQHQLRRFTLLLAMKPASRTAKKKTRKKDIRDRDPRHMGQSRVMNPTASASSSSSSRYNPPHPHHHHSLTMPNPNRVPTSFIPAQQQVLSPLTPTIPSSTSSSSRRPAQSGQPARAAGVPLVVYQEPAISKNQLESRRLQVMNRQSSSKTGICFTHAQLKSSCNIAFEAWPKLGEAALEVDKKYPPGESCLCVRVDSLMNLPKKASKEACARMVINLFDLFVEVRDNRNTYRLRGRDWNIVENKFAAVIGIMEEVDPEIQAEFTNGKEKDALLRSVQVTDWEKRRLYGKGGGIVPAIPFRACVFCNHCFVDEPPSNTSALGVNAMMQAKYLQTIDAWKKFEDGSVATAPLDSKGVAMKKPPKLPSFQKLLLRCHCLEIHAARPGSTEQSTCPWLCTDQMTGRKYAPNQCPLCKCSCRKVYQKDNLAAIKVAIQLRNDPNQGQAVDPAASAKRFMDDATFQGQAGYFAATNHVQKMVKEGKLDCSDDQMHQYTNDARNLSQANFSLGTNLIKRDLSISNKQLRTSTGSIRQGFNDSGRRLIFGLLVRARLRVPEATTTGLQRCTPTTRINFAIASPQMIRLLRS